MELNDHLKRRRFGVRALKSNLFIPGYCLNPDDDEPDLNIRMFPREDEEIALAFTSMAAMRRFFRASGLKSMKYMIIRPPSHLEAIVAIGQPLLVDAKSPAELAFSVADLAAILRQPPKGPGP